MGARCASLRIIGSIQSKEESKGDGERVSLISAYKSKVHYYRAVAQGEGGGGDGQGEGKA